MDIRFYVDPDGQQPHIYNHGVTEARMKKQAAASKNRKRDQQILPPGWNKKRVQEVIAYYDRQTEDEEAAEYERAMRVEGLAVMLVPTDLVPKIRRLMDRRRDS